MFEDLTAIIPVRAGSQRLKNKNVLPFGKSNLLIHKIRQLKTVKSIKNLIVSSDSDEMLEMAQIESKKNDSPVKIIIHKRAIEFCDEKTKTFNEVVENVVNVAETDNIMWAPCVCPLTTVSSYEKAIIEFKEKVLKQNMYDSVISGKLFKEYLFYEKGPLNWNPKKHVPSQQLPDWKVIVNGFYIAKKENMLKWRFLYGENPYLFVLNKKEAVDIDDEVDFEIAKALLGL